MIAAPEFWLLGSSHYRATTAGQLGLPFCYAGFINQGSTPEAVSAYRKSFIPCNGGKVGVSFIIFLKIFF